MVEGLLVVAPLQDDGGRGGVEGELEFEIKGDVGLGVAGCFADEVLVDVDSHLLLGGLADLRGVEQFARVLGRVH